MKNKTHRRHGKALWTLSFIWIILTLLLLGVVLRYHPVKSLIQNLPSVDFFYHEFLLIFILLVLSLRLYLKSRTKLSNFYSLHYALTNALKFNRFQPVYQPIKDSRSEHFCGAEVLLRWQTESNEIIMPDAFITEAEESKLIIPITLQLIENAFLQTKNLLKQQDNFHLAFNLSAQHFTDDHFFNDFYTLCSEYEIPAHQVMLEFTERQLLDQSDPGVMNKMNDLRNRGYSLAIDDFGTGHASIKYLQHFPFNYLKIDQIFVQAIGTGAITETLNHTIIHMARCLKLSIIAEGVETKEQLEFLRKQQVDYVQGWYFAKAMSYKELVMLIEKDSK